MITKRAAGHPCCDCTTQPEPSSSEGCDPPASISVRVLQFCSPFPPLEGMTVEVLGLGTDTVLFSGTTGEDGVATIEVDSPGTYDVRVTVGECVELIEGVAVAECAQVELDDVSICCKDWCIYVYDAHTGSPISGASVSVSFSSGTTDGDGLFCVTPLIFGSVFMGATATGYHGKGSAQVCLPCDCAEASIPLSLYPTSDYVFVQGRDDCPGADPCDDATGRATNLVQYPLYVEFTGATPTFGDIPHGILELALVGDPATGGEKIFEAWTTGGYANKETLTWNGTEWISTTIERFDFPAARVRVVTNRSDIQLRTWLEWENYIDEAGTITADFGYEFVPRPISPAINDQWVRLVAVSYCSGAQFYPYKIRNLDATRPGGTLSDDMTEWLLDELRKEVYLQSNNQGFCLPSEMGGVFWRGKGGCTDLTVGFTLYE
jgi:hypothetical protein